MTRPTLQKASLDARGGRHVTRRGRRVHRMDDRKSEEEDTASIPPFDDVALVNEQKCEVAVTELWRRRRVVLAWLRHFGCRFCKQQAVAMERIRKNLEENDVGVIVVAIGTPEQIPKFRAETGFAGDIWVDKDPDRPLSYRLMQLKRGTVEEIIYPEGARAAAEVATKDGFVDGGYASATLNAITQTNDYTGDILQVGGVFVLGPGNVCDFAYRSKHAGDHPANSKEVVEIATGKVFDESWRVVDDFVYRSSLWWSKVMSMSLSVGLTKGGAEAARPLASNTSYFRRTQERKTAQDRMLAWVFFAIAAILFALSGRYWWVQ